MPIVPSDTSPKRELARKLLDAFLEEIPLLGGPLNAIYSVTYPAKGEIDTAVWQKEVSDRINSIDEALKYITGTIPISEDAAFLGK